MKLLFYLRFHTQFGQTLWIVGDDDELGNNDPHNAIPLAYLNDEFWCCSLEIKKKDLQKKISYRYILKNENNDLVYESGTDRIVELPAKSIHEIQLVDTWNNAGDLNNVFCTAAFTNVLFKSTGSKGKITSDKNFTHSFSVKAPLLQKHEVICLIGTGSQLKDWDTNEPIMMGKKGNWWTARVNLSESSFPVAYKYGVFNTKEKIFRYETGNNRLLYSDASKKKISFIEDGFVHLPNITWKGTGIAVPVFSLRSKNGFGVGEFTDIKQLVDWAKTTGIKLIQLLPVNDTVSTHTWKDSYPYSIISAFALHPLYINLEKVAGKEYASQLKPLTNRQKQLNEKPVVGYEEVINFKISILRELYKVMAADCFESAGYQQFYLENKKWLDPYAVFCYYRDKYRTANFELWKTGKIYKEKEIQKLCSVNSTAFSEIAFYFFVQYHLHLQLKEAAAYARKKQVVLKGDIPIGISRYSVDAWVSPGLYNVNLQSGAPPDDFAIVGQNWGFPTYNWKKMEEDDFTWWKQRFAQMNMYVDAFRIDHILGFFRIWSIPADAIQGIMGRFDPCLPVHINEFGEQGIWFDYQRYCRPYITNEIVTDSFGEQSDEIISSYLQPNEFGGYDMADGFETQKQIEDYFKTLDTTEANQKTKLALFGLVSNVILFEEAGSEGLKFHFRIAIEKTSSFKNLDEQTRQKLHHLYIDYFYRRQDRLWFKEAMHKLPKLKGSTNMLVCGEDLGMVPEVVPIVMNQLGILSLEVQRMPKRSNSAFFHPNDAPYLSVITPSTHDMSTIREWWEEDPEKTRHFYNEVLGQWGDPPAFCEAWINRAIVLQHLYAPAMWSIFQLQDILGMSEKIRRENPYEERINNPANPSHYWQYRMHITLEELVNEKEYNTELEGYIKNSGRL